MLALTLDCHRTHNFTSLQNNNYSDRLFSLDLCEFFFVWIPLIEIATPTRSDPVTIFFRHSPNVADLTDDWHYQFIPILAVVKAKAGAQTKTAVSHALIEFAARI